MFILNIRPRFWGGGAPTDFPFNKLDSSSYRFSAVLTCYFNHLPCPECAEFPSNFPAPPSEGGGVPMTKIVQSILFCFCLRGILFHLILPYDSGVTIYYYVPYQVPLSVASMDPHFPRSLWPPVSVFLLSNHLLLLISSHPLRPTSDVNPFGFKSPRALFQTKYPTHVSGPPAATRSRSKTFRPH